MPDLRAATEARQRLEHVALVVAVGEEAERALGDLLHLVGTQLHGVEAAAREERRHVGEHLAGCADLAAEAVAHAQQARLAVGAAVGPLGEDQGDARVAIEVGRDPSRRRRRWPARSQPASSIDEADRRAHACTAVARRTALAATLNGSMPTRRTVAMKRSPLSVRSAR
jgi:hypothetical protein